MNRLLVRGGVAVLVVALAVAGAFVLLEGGAGGARQSAGCAPRPCVAPNGFELYVDSITRSGQDVVLRFHVVNHTTGGAFEATSDRHTGLSDFRVRAAGTEVDPDIGPTPPGCTKWDELAVARGATSPPRTACYRVPAGVDMTLEWSPDLGLVFRSVDLPLGRAP